MTTRHRTDRRRRSRAIRSGLAALYGWPAVKRWAGLPPAMSAKDRAKMVERIDWERVNFGGKSRRQVAEEQGCKYRTAQLAARRLHIPLEKVPPRRPKQHNRGAPVGNQNARKYPKQGLYGANGIRGAQALEIRRRAERAQHAQGTRR